jgi:hypothetical protein
MGAAGFRISISTAATSGNWASTAGRCGWRVFLGGGRAARWLLHEGKDGGVIDSRGEVVVAHLVAFREAAGEVDEETLAEAALFIEDAVAAVDGDVDQFDFDHREKG